MYAVTFVPWNGEYQAWFSIFSQKVIWRVKTNGVYNQFYEQWAIYNRR